MADRDPAFEWETEALRERTRRRPAPGSPAAAESIEPGWVTLRQAAGATAIPLGTLRRWSRQGSVPTRSQMTDSGTRRLVWLDAVLERARSLGRSDATSHPEPQVTPRPAPPPPPPPAQPEPPVEIPGQQQLVDDADVGVAADRIVVETDDLPESQTDDEPSSPPTPPMVGDAKAAPPDPPPGTMLVPVDAWNKMLLQLGNLHEAGRDLAEARERAARAETEATFLRERLKDLRERSEPAPLPAGPIRRRRRWFRRD